MMKDENSELGAVKIHKEVIAAIASIAIAETEGAIKLKGDLKSSLAEFVGKKDYPGIVVIFDKGNRIKLEVRINVKYGYHIPDIAGKVQENIRASIEKMTDLNLGDINVNIQGIERG
jgi:uncharacterized alkaline shock family protein YloU